MCTNNQRGVEKLGCIVVSRHDQESHPDLVPSDDSSFNRGVTKYCRYVISRTENKLPRSHSAIEIPRVPIATLKRDSRKGAFIASTESLHHFINPVGIENSSHSRQKLPLFPDSRDDSRELTYSGPDLSDVVGSNNAIRFVSLSLSFSFSLSSLHTIFNGKGFALICPV